MRKSQADGLGSALAKSRRLLAVTMLMVGAVASAAVPAEPEVDYRFDEMPDYKPEQPVNQIIRVAGFNGARKLLDLFEQGFKKFHPDARLEYDYSGRGSITVPAVLYTKQADIGLMRELWRSEALSFYRVFSSEPQVIDAVTGSYESLDKTAAMVVIVHKDNPIDKLTMQQLDGIFGEARTGGYDGMYWTRERARGAEDNIRQWHELGVKGEWRGKPIQVYGQDLLNGFAHYFSWRVLQGSQKWNPNLYEFGFSLAKEGPNKGQMGIDNGAHTSGSAPLVEAISNNRYGIGYCLVRDLTPGVKALALSDNGDKYVTVSKATVVDRSYPLWRSLYWVFHRAPGDTVDPKLKEYMRFVFSRQGQEAVLREGEWLPLTPELVAEGRRRLE